MPELEVNKYRDSWPWINVRQGMKLGKIMIFVSDIDTARSFYRDILGFPVKAETGDRLELVHEDVDFVAFKCEKDAIVEDYSSVARSVFVFEVESVEKSMESLRALGVKFLHEIPAENDFSRYAAFSDPFGNVHEIFQRK
jgi:catechol 2,3-dioxygenase-like lactoylglutathione lyase family enzyme